MRKITTATIMKAIRDMRIKANHGLVPDMRKVLEKTVKEEEPPLGCQALSQLKENLKIAGKDKIPICQDTGMAVIFMKIGQDVYVAGGRLAGTVNEDVRRGHEQGYLRESVVGNPIEGINTKDNTPAAIHYKIADGEQISITVAPEGFGNENISRVLILKPTDGLEGVKKSILQAVREAGPNTCPPMVVGVGIGGAFEKCTQMTKHALTGGIEDKPGEQWVRDLGEGMLDRTNQSGIGPEGLGGRVTVLAVSIETFATHIAGLSSAVDTCCRVNRHVHRVL